MKTQSARTLAAQFATSPALKPIALAVALALTSPHAVFATPTGATVVAGQALVTQPNAQTTLVKQGSDKAIINWRSFSIAAGQTVDFQQPNSSSVALNRVTTPTPSEIFGRLSANGKVFLVNPSGVLFGKGASVDVGGLVASTLNISDADFLAGRFSFSDGGGSAGAVRNDGTLAAAERGTIALLGAQVSNNGTITARLGTVGLAAGGKVSLDFNGDGLTRIVVDAARINALVENGGAVISEGGQVIMSARAVAALADTVVRHDGIVQANSLVERNGRIVLDGGSAGKVEVAGTVEASGLGAGARGGAVTVIGKDLILAGSSTIDVRGDAGGGAVLVGGDYQGGNPLIPHASSTTMAAGATIRADALGNGDGGKVILWSDNASSVHGSVSARAGALGGDGGLVETSGRSVDDIGMRVNASSAKGKAGTWLVDPENRTVDATLAASIAATLDNGTNYTLRTNDHDFQERGDINVNANIIKAAGGNVKLTLEADHDIIVAAGVQIASTSPTGKLDVDFNANARGTANTGITIDDAFGEGAIVMKAGSSIKTNGGDIRFYGQSDPISGFARGNTYNRDGIRLNNVTLDTRTGGVDSGAGGNVSMRAIGDFDHDDGVADG
ncbi:MAG: hypothetical protein JWP34_4906, partial [Massilia sp.]|nr:hypothetical protein [Massilia sp.]